MNILEMKDIYKAFPGIIANDHVNLTLEKGEVLALIGENGAGKSTLMKILSGAQRADSGTITIDGKSMSGYNTKEAIDLGIGIVYQELNYLGFLSV
ncbi:MAG: sugar ABC transporter ATP-binding protein, partial [Clostridia bacterium]|nr:sugar ABC transporter ATP-binding protein [Clostridia bacterium]